uniref:Uncharacterized protein n=1 Tax=Onchocerca volvulus TaxID=6282 RepID=A0A8R1TLQ1_ONCVO
MDLKFLIVLRFVVNYAIPLNITSTETKYDQNSDEILQQVFVNRQMGGEIARYLSDEELKNMATVKIMSDAANFELNHRVADLLCRDNNKSSCFIVLVLSCCYRMSVWSIVSIGNSPVIWMAIIRSAIFWKVAVSTVAIYIDNGWSESQVSSLHKLINSYFQKSI